MKKVSYLLTVILSFFIFYSGFQAYSSDQMQRLDLFSESICEKNNTELYVVNLTFENNTENKQKIISEIKDYLTSNSYSGVINVPQNTEDLLRKVNHYVYMPSAMLKGTLYLRNSKQIDFIHDTNHYFTTDIKDSNASDWIDYMDQNLYEGYHDIFEIHPMNDYVFDCSQSDMIALYILGNTNSIRKSLEKSNLRPYIMQSDHDTFFSETETTVYEAVKPDLSNFVFGCSLLAIILIIITVILKDRKEIMISKLFGLSNMKLFRSLYTKYLISLPVMYSLTTILCYTYFVGNFRETTKDYLAFIGFYNIAYILSICIIAVILYGGIHALTSNEFMKQTKVKDNRTIVSMVLKLCLLMIVFIPCVTHGWETYDSLSILHTLLSNEKTMTNAIMLNGIIFDNTDIFEQQNTIQKLYSYIDKHNGIYEEFNYVENYELVLQGNQPLPFSITYPFITVNDNYLKDYKIQDSKGNEIDMNTLKESTLLIPDNYHLSDEQISFFCKGRPYNILSIKAGNTFTSHNPNNYTSNTLTKKNPIILLDKQWMESTSFSTDNYFIKINDEKDLNDFKSFISDNHLEKAMNFHLNKAYYDVNVSKLSYQVITSGFYTLLMLLLVFIYQIYTAIMYVHESRFIFALEYLMGKTFLQRYGSYLYTNILLYLVIVAAGVFMSSVTIMHIILFGLIMLIIDNTILYVTIRTYENKESANMLKGG